MAEPIAKLFKDGNRYALHYPEYDIWIRGAYAEWVLMAGAEMIIRIEKLKSEGSITELDLTREFVTEVDGDVDTQIDALRYAASRRFDIIPQCVVTMHDTDYRWVAKADVADSGAVERLLDMSQSRSNSFLSGSPPRLS
jgi:hypothetical protein